MVEWTLQCEKKRSVCKNINGVARKMRECLIRLYYTLDEIRSNKTGTNSSVLERELAQVNLQVNEFRGECKAKERIGRG